MNILEISAIQIMIFAQDTIPYHLLLRPDKIKILEERFSFQNSEIPFPIYQPDAPRILNLFAGEVKSKDKLIIIDRLSFEDRRINVKIKGSTSEIESVIDIISNTLKDVLEGNWLDPSKILLKTDQTECITELDIDILAIFSPKLRKFMRANLPKKLANKVETINPKRFSIELSFEQPAKYRSHNISLSPKLFTVEPRKNTALEDKVFFTASPCPSDIHIELLKEFEEEFRA